MGWVYSKRDHGKLVFITLCDSTGLTQVAIRKQKIAKKVFERAKNITLESSVAVQGIVHTDPRAPGGAEIYCSNFKIISLAAEDYPIKKDTSKVFLLDQVF